MSHLQSVIPFGDFAERGVILRPRGFKKSRKLGGSGRARPLTGGDIANFVTTISPFAFGKTALSLGKFGFQKGIPFGGKVIKTASQSLSKEVLSFASGPLRFARRKAIGAGIASGTIFGLGAGVGSGIFSFNPFKTFGRGKEFGENPNLNFKGPSLPGQPPIPPTPKTLETLETPRTPSTPEGDVILNLPGQPTPQPQSSGLPGPILSGGPSPTQTGIGLGILALLGLGGFALLKRKKKSKKKKTKKKKKKKKSKTKRNKKTGRFV